MTAPHVKLRPELAPLRTYNAGLSLEAVADRCGGGPIAKLGSNENPHEISPQVKAAMAQAVETAFLYPDPTAGRLARKISHETGVAVERMIFGDGSEDLLNVLARTLLQPGDEVVTLYPSFPLHEDYAQMMGAAVTRIELTHDHRIDIDALLAAAARPVRLILLANPMNPAGLWLSADDLARLLAAQHPDSVLCLDEAYVEYAKGGDFEPATRWLRDHDKPLLILRTFSKAYGLAALRIGYGFSNSDDLIGGMNLVRTPFNVNAVAQAAALAALDQPEHVETGVRDSLAERDRMAAALSDLGLTVLPSKGNFLFVDCGRPATELADRLLDAGVIVKPWKQEGYESFIRVSAGLPPENTQFLDALTRLLAAPGL
ncbi:histidinol-phosphate transaminase [Pseudodonghicola xiamenensis]|uniref:Histidinol-phosphate aminotransferase n=1 Tax=Pseudodonghicola xiamenensis TaxID=337702 RepID=A0A8J3H644_9RHOB|nr:histidinol-phosphate transaminase [Pseudodonghicola xiamenensis]GHG86252.1 histidinol-phosphate aminotransferase [Pseudodonghicola xiamenensis]